MLYISTSFWVLCTPKAGQNLHVQQKNKLPWSCVLIYAIVPWLVTCKWQIINSWKPPLPLLLLPRKRKATATALLLLHESHRYHSRYLAKRNPKPGSTACSSETNQNQLINLKWSIEQKTVSVGFVLGTFQSRVDRLIHSATAPMFVGLN